MTSVAGLRTQLVQDVVGPAHERRDRVDGGDLGDPFGVAFLALGQAPRELRLTLHRRGLGRGAQVAHAHRDAFAIEREHQHIARGARLRGPRQAALEIEVVEVDGGAAHHLLHLALGHVRPRLRGQHPHGLVEGALRRLLRRAAPNAQ
jgi:hypothetical protein